MQVPVLSAETADRRKKFFEFLFNRTDGGYVCVARRKLTGVFEEKFFRWPEDESAALDYVTSSIPNHNVWFCPMILSHPTRNKHNVELCPGAWSDLDACPPDKLLIPPTLLLETSPNRHQALWCFDELADPLDAEEISKRIAYFHAEDGADKSGWDLTQLLRVPYTMNHKYDPPATVRLVAATDVMAQDVLREAYPVVSDDKDELFPFPEHVPDGQALLIGLRDMLDAKVWMLLKVPPEKDWSRSLWALEMRLAESNLSKEEIFAIVKEAACNKYARDNRDERLLWREVCKAWVKHRERSVIVADATIFKPPELLTDEDRRAVSNDRTFLDDYIDWAKTVGDAAEAYHHAGAFICLSSLMAGSVQLPTSFGIMVPNLWFLLLADTTLTRKSTALDLAVDLVMEVEPDAIMATDGSIEGMFTALSLRPGMPSIFLRDEFSGLIEVMAKRDYYAGMAETLTKMYDGKFQKRVLRRETIEVRDPVLIIFAGGIRTKILSLLTTEQVTSGFLPRFIFVAAQSDLSRLQPLGPPSAKVSAERQALLDTMQLYKERYHRNIDVKVQGVEMKAKNVRTAILTPEAWALYNSMELKLLETGIKNASQDLLTPVMDRLAKSGLKASVLIAASRMEDQVVVRERDIMKAFSFVTMWRDFAIDVVSSIGLPQVEKMINTVHAAILRHPGIMRSTLMNQYHLTKRDADFVLDTLEQRGLIERAKSGRSESLTPSE